MSDGKPQRKSKSKERSQQFMETSYCKGTTIIENTTNNSLLSGGPSEGLPETYLISGGNGSSVGKSANTSAVLLFKQSLNDQDLD